MTSPARVARVGTYHRLGPDHSHTLAARSYLASWRGMRPGPRKPALCRAVSGLCDPAVQDAEGDEEQQRGHRHYDRAGGDLIGPVVAAVE